MNTYIVVSDQGNVLEELEAHSTVQAVAQVSQELKGCGCGLWIDAEFLMPLY